VSDDEDSSVDETQPYIELTMGEITVCAQGRSTDTLEDVSDVFDEKYQRAISDYVEIVEDDDPDIGAY